MESHNLLKILNQHNKMHTLTAHQIQYLISGVAYNTQEKAFKQPFEKKISKEDNLFNFSAGSYRWGAPSATYIKQISWSEAFHIPLSDILQGSAGFRSTIEHFAATVSSLAHTLAEILAEIMGYSSSFFQESSSGKVLYGILLLSFS
ncbi:hypothetical protein L6164_032173 [Bauhinia variegata]|uniref:Uncharacterized protein n=1 Tax=Bauhinia variegata TaxID=167791 RepID=A0ACB9KMU5_BAUVA|nr:hypothetical protein L6164_032173 [Bauhinia variegata]